MVKIRVSETTNSPLDWLVVKCEGVAYRYIRSTGGDYNGNWAFETRRYSTDQAQMGSIIDRERIDTAIAELGLDYLAKVAGNRAVLRELCRRVSHGITGDKP